ncbi:MAG TPA: DUF87 domain-containing protein [Candidatus Saccharimonadia bacterium]|nr:DUF87 domain-containing protein [Candidatus Saccharimonadia bacterium]
MESILVAIFIILICLAIFAPVILFQIRRIMREQKNYERGLKMVTLLINLPPSSEDISVNGRDSRDVADENISKAQTIYSIISSTFKDDFKSRFYGQRHFSFEIVGSKGFINYYAAVPLALSDRVKQAVVSAYPTARLEEVPDNNIFSPIGRLNATVGGELTLKEEFAYPIATYQEIKRDPMQTILNSMSALDKEDGAGIQFLIRPANPGWRKVASDFANKKRKGNGGSKSTFETAVSLANKIIVNPENDKKDTAKEDKTSNLDQTISDSIEDKVKYPGFEILVRVVASSNLVEKSHSILNNIVASFAIYDSPGKNGFKFTSAKDMESFTTAYILRFFPPENNKSVVNSVELATLFHFPDRENIPTAQLERQSSKQVDAPRNMPEDGLLLGYNIFRGVKKAIKLDLEDRRRHVYVVGQTGTGKSVFLKNLALQDMVAGRGFAFIDPHGDVAEELLSMVPKERTEDVIYFSPAESNFPLGLNLFEYQTEDQRDFLIQEAIKMLQKLYDPNNQGIVGPRYEYLFRNAALTVMADPAGGTFIDIPKLFIDKAFLAQKLKHVTDRTVLDFWQKEVPQSERSNDFGEVKSWFVSKFGAFQQNVTMRNIIGQPKSAFNLRQIMDDGKILIANLSKGRLGELNSYLLGMIFVMKFQQAALSRADIDEEDRRDFCLFVDEFQNFSTDSFATMMSEARKFGLNLIVANQFTTQLSDEIRDAVFGNIGTIVAFRVGQKDVEALTKYFQPLFDEDDLLRVPNHNAIVRTLIHGVPTEAFSMEGVPPSGRINKELVSALKQLTATKYGKPKAEVEKLINDRLTTIEVPSAFSRPFGQSSNGPAFTPNQPYTGGVPIQPTKKPGASSFLDEWLAKRRQPNATNAPNTPTSFNQSTNVDNATEPDLKIANINSKQDLIHDQTLKIDRSKQDTEATVDSTKS